MSQVIMKVKRQKQATDEIHDCLKLQKVKMNATRAMMNKCRVDSVSQACKASSKTAMQCNDKSAKLMSNFKLLKVTHQKCKSSAKRAKKFGKFVSIFSWPFSV